MTEKIALQDLINGEVYKLHSRNLRYGVWVEDRNGFIGVREKFSDKFLFMEYEQETSLYHGTAVALKRLNIVVPENIALTESFPPVDKETNRPVTFTTPIASGGEGWVYLDDGLRVTSGSILSVENKELFNLLSEVEAQN